MHSIIIPHRNRLGLFNHCIYSIHRSATMCDARSWEIVLVDCGEVFPSTRGKHVRVVRDDGQGEVYNKARALNIGIEQARGDVLTFLDGDMIVGGGWMDCVRRLEDAELVRVAYRVRYLPVKAPLEDLHAMPTDLRWGCRSDG